jgi:hypothetical protein
VRQEQFAANRQCVQNYSRRFSARSQLVKATKNKKSRRKKVAIMYVVCFKGAGRWLIPEANFSIKESASHLTDTLDAPRETKPNQLVILKQLVPCCRRAEINPEK